MTHLETPISEQAILGLHAGDSVEISGIALTARDAAHKYMVEKLIKGKRPLAPGDQEMYDMLMASLREGVIYHCGPVVRQESGKWQFISSGPTTSIREEIYEPEVIAAFNVRVIMGKGGMGPHTLEACRKYRAVYVQAIGGAGVLSASAVEEVLAVYKEEEFGLAEAFWKIRLNRFAGIVTMDAHGRSLHTDRRDESARKFESLMGKPAGK